MHGRRWGARTFTGIKMNGCVLETRVEFPDNFRDGLVMSTVTKESFRRPFLTVCLKTGKGKGCSVKERAVHLVSLGK